MTRFGLDPMDNFLHEGLLLKHLICLFLTHRILPLTSPFVVIAFNENQTTVIFLLDQNVSFHSYEMQLCSF